MEVSKKIKIALFSVALVAASVFAVLTSRESNPVSYLGSAGLPPEKFRGEYLERRALDSYRSAIVANDPSLVIQEEERLLTKKAPGAPALFSVSRLAYSYQMHDRTMGHLVQILNSDDPGAESFKSIAAYFLLHVFYDSGGDIELLSKGIQSSDFLKTLTPEAKKAFPEVFGLPFDSMAYPQKARYFAAYLVALSERGDSAAIPANAATEVMKYYITLQKSGAEQALIEKYENMLRDQLRKVITRLDTILAPGFSGDVSAYDLVVGMNHLAGVVNNLRHFGFEAKFPEIEGIDATYLLGYSQNIAAKEAPALDMYTTYLYAVQLAKFSENSIENDERINALVKRVTGLAPFEGVTDSSWASRRLIGSRSGGYSSVYRRENVAALARRSSLLREFLILKDGWTVQDFELRDRF